MGSLAVRLIALMCFAPGLAFAAKASKAAEAQEAYRAGKFARASELYAAALVNLKGSERGTTVEQDLREKLVLCLYAAKKEQPAVAEYKELKRRFPSFAFDPDRVSPDTVKFFEAQTVVVVAPASAPEAPASSAPVSLAPRTIETVTASSAPAVTAQTKRWHWYYLAPLGIGQFLAGSPVRGALLMAFEVGMIVMNAVGFALLHAQLRPDGTVPSLAKAAPLQVITNVGFFGWIGGLALGVIDGAALEP